MMRDPAAHRALLLGHIHHPKAARADALALFDHVRARHEDVAVMGRSLGSGVAVQLAAERVDEALDDVQPESGAAVRVRQHVVELHERVEDAREVPLRDADAGVGDVERERAGLGIRELHGHAAAAHHRPVPEQRQLRPSLAPHPPRSGPPPAPSSSRVSERSAPSAGTSLRSGRACAPAGPPSDPSTASITPATAPMSPPRSIWPRSPGRPGEGRPGSPSPTDSPWRRPARPSRGPDSISAPAGGAPVSFSAAVPAG